MVDYLFPAGEADLDNLEFLLLSGNFAGALLETPDGMTLSVGQHLLYRLFFVGTNKPAGSQEEQANTYLRNLILPVLYKSSADFSVVKNLIQQSVADVQDAEETIGLVGHEGHYQNNVEWIRKR